ncbi:MAG: chromosome segregation protein SMC [Tissierellia bacterium]|nr:chromosome segregation protein SMC [Tissierellia bacterium]
MRLKELELFGFKSFAKRTKIKFSEGVTAIVGPNGSGKSNIVDAIIWALGEQSAKQLRGQKMEDVIFSGTQNKAPLGFVEVTLVFDNGDRFLDIDFKEVAIRRKMYRSGESEFYINNQAVRLKDIRELFMDTGIGKDGYSFIGQGQIDQVLSHRPQDRRAIFEEAAGIGRFRHKKDKSLKSLEKTKDNLIRLGDILREVDSQEERLRKEKNQAQAYLDYKAEKDHLDLKLALLKLDRVKKDQKDLRAQEASLAKEKEDLDQALGNLRAAYHKGKLSLEGLEKDWESSQDRRLSLAQNIEKIEAQRTSQESLNQRLGQEIGGRKKEAQALEDRLEDIQEEKKKKETDLRAKEKVLGQLQDAYGKKDQVLQKLLKEKRDLEGQKRIWEEEERAQLSEDSRVKSRLEALAYLNREKEARLEALKNQDQRSRLQVQDMEADVKKRLGEKEDLLGQLDHSRKDQEAQEASLSKYLKEYGLLRDQTQELQGKLKDLEREAAFNQRILDNHEGFSYPVKSFLNQVKSKPGLSQDIIGPLANQIDVREGYELAITTALGGAAQNILIKDDRQVGAMIGFLKERKLGRVTFLPLTSLKTSSYDLSRLPRVHYPVYLASDLVAYDQALQAAIGFTLGRTLLVDSLEDGKDLSQRTQRRYRIVTKTGDLFNVGGSITGGRQRQENVDLLSRKKDIKKLSLAIGSQQEKLSHNESRLAQVKGLLEDLEGQKSNLDQRVREAKERLIRLEEILESLEKSKLDLEERRGRIQEEIKKEEEGLKANQVEIEDLEKLELSSKRDSRIQAFQDLLNHLDHLNQEEDQQKTDITRLKEKLGQEKDLVREYSFSLKSLVQEEESSRRRLEDLQSSLKDYKKEVQEGQALIEEKTQDLARLQEDHEKVMDQLGRLKERKEGQAKDLEVLENRERDLLEKTNHHIRKEESLNHKLDRIQESYGEIMDFLRPFDPKDLKGLEIKEEESLDHLRKERNKVHRQIEALGYVNLNALEEYKEVSQRQAFIHHQKDDLLASKEKLEKVVSELEREMKKVFAQSLTQIQAHFDQIFKELFKGGQATLKLEDEDHVLESGILIEVQPPGKKLQSLSLLSGGERSMTAVALLFSLLRVRQSPFCILDEIDAALDEANINRYKTYLKKMSPMQFIMITHRKSTMEIAEYLYGVTMEEKGMSTVISLALEEVEKDV